MIIVTIIISIQHQRQVYMKEIDRQTQIHIHIPTLDTQYNLLMVVVYSLGRVQLLRRHGL